MAKIDSKTNNQHVSASKALDDEQRVRVLSPGMLVAKRFFRNKLAMAGLIILVSMFLFSFLGGLIIPYGESEVFRTTETALKDFAGATVNDEFQYHIAEGAAFPTAAGAQMILAVNKGESTFVSKDQEYSLIKEGDDFYRISGFSELATIAAVKGKYSFKETNGASVSEREEAAAIAAIEAAETQFELDGTAYSVVRSGKFYSLSKTMELAVASKLIFNPYSQDAALSYDFMYQAEKALHENRTSFQADGAGYTAQIDPESGSAIFFSADGAEYASVSKMAIRPVGKDVFLTAGFRTDAEHAIQNKQSEFTHVTQDGEEEIYKIENKNTQYTIRRYEEVTVNSRFDEPSGAHLLGTDGNGMDIFTRLMYGGRISLMIGFVAVFIEVLIGIIIGGFAGYFGKWVDNALMRLVDIISCIPAMPLYIILGSIMDYYKLDGRIRIYLLCVILGLLSWPSIARMVRGQILSLREQEFMVAAEATGINTFHRVFKHLIPNVIPQLIVIATMDLGSIILTEATLSFLGLGVKYPFASWGNIINAVNDIYVMTNYWYVWIPAGMLILLTVLGFNFVGDGLRDAFDPKMKR